MKKKIEFYIIGCIIGFCVLCSLIIIGLFFVYGTSTIFYDHWVGSNNTTNHTSITKNTTSFRTVNEYIFETGGFATHHLIENFLICVIFSSSLYYLPKYFGYNKSLSYGVRILLYYFIMSVQISTAIWWEWWEFFVVIFWDNLCLILPYLIKYRKYVRGPENCLNSMLSDFPQAVFGSLYVILLIEFGGVIASSYYLYKRSIPSRLLRLFIYCISSLTVLLTHIKKRYVVISYSANLGFYLHCNIRVITLCLFYLDDLIKFKKHRKDINKFWIIVIGFVILQWISTLDLRTWGFVVSNITAIIYILVWILYNNMFDYKNKLVSFDRLELIDNEEIEDESDSLHFVLE